jgi:hypothetical protein
MPPENYRYVPVDSVFPRTTDVLHWALQEHVKTCDQCRSAIDSGPPRGFGARTRMCAKYQQLIMFFASGAEL